MMRLKSSTFLKAATSVVSRQDAANFYQSRIIILTMGLLLKTATSVVSRQEANSFQTTVRDFNLPACLGVIRGSKTVSDTVLKHDLCELVIAKALGGERCLLQHISIRKGYQSQKEQKRAKTNKKRKRQVQEIDLRKVIKAGSARQQEKKGIVTTSRYVVPTGRVVKVPAGRYVVPTGKDNVIVSAGRTKVIPAGRTLLVLLLASLKGFVVLYNLNRREDLSRAGPTSGIRAWREPLLKKLYYSYS
ncbi:hypothetical protein Tco_0704151 [Tanacetum coccineum]|uniref:Uncharacterized protein n=1 Tax=Tanacetum coccineum TaxID=301880 RepID=A0ABQ4Y0V1_9ASTR